MPRPERSPSGLINYNGVDAFFKRFFNRCTETSEITDEEFITFTHECFNEVLNAHYGMVGYTYIIENQEKFQNSKK